VESPGTAPGSDPLITWAFMSIVPKDNLYIGRLGRVEKGGTGLYRFWAGNYPQHQKPARMLRDVEISLQVGRAHFQSTWEICSRH